MNYVDEVVVRSIRNGILLDTNLLIVFLIGMFKPELISSFKKTSSYSISDFNLIRNIVLQFNAVHVTPQILSEVSNSTFHQGIMDPDFSSYVGQLISYAESSNELYYDKNRLISLPRFTQIGFTDVSVMEVAKQTNCLVLTDDFILASILENEGHNTLNINHIRFSV